MKKLLVLISLMLAAMLLLSSCSLIFRPTKPDEGGDFGDIGGNGAGGGEHVHAYGEWITEIPATCSADGLEKAVCHCGDVIVQPIPAVSHTFTEWNAANPPAGANVCEWIPTYARICTSCGLTETKSDGVAPGHVWGEWSFVSSSATHDIYIRICKTCGNSEFKQEEIGGTETHIHKWGQDYTITELPTLMTNGSANIFCTDCGVVTIITLPYILDSQYTISRGNCIYPYDQYTFTYNSEINNVSGINISFSVYVGYLHDAAPEKEDCVITEGDNYIYYSYLCSQCDRYIIAYTEEKLPETPGYSVGLEYQLSSDGTYYIVTGIGICTDADIVIPATYNGLPVSEIGDSAFYTNDDYINTVTIPDSVNKISEDAFYFCRGISHIDVSNDNKNYMSIDGNLYTKDGKTIVRYAAGKNDTEFNIPSGVEFVGNYAFSNSRNLTNVVIPSTVTSIGDWAFWDCSGLTSVTIPDSVTTIGDRAYLWDNGIISVTIGSGVTVFGDASFAMCASITTVYYRGTVEKWDSISFGYDCMEITNATRYYYSETQPTTEGNFWHYVDGVPTVWEAYVAPENPAYSIGLEYTPNGDGNCYVSGIGTCTDTVLRIPPVAPDGKVIGVGDFAFNGCKSIVSVELPDTIVAIGYNAFYGCEALESINIPEGVYIIPWFTFVSCTSLKSISLPKSLVRIEGCAFKDCTSLSTVYYGGNEADWNAITIDSFETDNSYVASATRYYYSETEPTTEGNFWHYVDGVPTTWDTYKSPGLYDENGNCLASWEELSNVYGLDIEIDYLMGGTYNTPSSIQYIVRNNSKFSTATRLVVGNNVTQIGDWALSGCDWLTSVQLNSNVTSIASYSFAYCYNLKEVTIPDSVTQIKEYSFSFCESLESIILPGSLTSINPSAFYTANHTTTNVFYAGTQVEWNGIIENTSIYGNTLSNATLYFYSETQPTAEGNFWHYVDGVPTVWDVYVEPTYSIGLEYTSNGDGTCYVSGIGTCTDTDIVIPAVSPEGWKVTGIGDMAFYINNSITSVIIPNSVISIGDQSFTYCDKLLEISIPDSVTKIGYAPFNSSNIINISVDTNNVALSSIDGNLYSKDGTILYAYAKGKTNSHFVIPDGVTTIGNSAFLGCDKLTSVAIGDSVTTISANAFCGCTSLKSLIIPDSVTTISAWAFGSCSTLTYVVIPDSVTAIGDYAFAYCDNLAVVYYEGTSNNWSQINIDNSYGCNTTFLNISRYYYTEAQPTTDGNFWHYVNGVPTVWEVDNTVYSQGLEFKSNGNGTCYVAGIGACTDSEIVIPKYSPEGYVVAAIGDSAFNDCAGITSIIIPEGVTRIGSYAFRNCSSLKKVVIPESVEYMSNSPFANCTAIEEIVFVDPVGWYYQYPMEVAISADALSDPKTAAVTLMTNVPSIASFIKR